MVLSGPNRTSSISSIVNQNQGGGNKKAGLPQQIGRSYWFPIALTTHQSRNTLYDVNGIFGLQRTVNPNICQSRPVSSWTNGNTYWSNCMNARR